jgi:hypothetical protein
MSNNSIFIAHPQNSDQVLALKAIMTALKIKFEVANIDENHYDKEFVSKINESIQDYNNGKITTVEKNELESFLGLK